MDKTVYGHAGVPSQTQEFLNHAINQCASQANQCGASCLPNRTQIPGEVFGYIEREVGTAQSAKNRQSLLQQNAQPFTVWDLVQEAHQSLSGLQDRIGALESRLDTVLMPASPTGEGIGGDTDGPAAVLHLRSLIARMNATAERVTDINARVRV